MAIGTPSGGSGVQAVGTFVEASIAVSAGETVFVEGMAIGVAIGDPPTLSCSDQTNGETAEEIGNFPFTSEMRVSVFKIEVATGATKTIRITSSASTDLHIIVHKNSATGGFTKDQATFATGTGTSGEKSSGAVTTTVADEYLIGGLVNSFNKGPVTPTSPWTELVDIATGEPEGQVQYRVVSATGSYASLSTFAESHAGTRWLAWIVTLSETGGGGGGVSGDAAVSLPALTAAAAGAVAVQGAGSTTLPALTASAAGAVAVEGTAATTLPALILTASGSAVASRTGDGAVTMPTLAASAAGSVSVTGSAATTLPALTVSAAGAVAIEGAGATTLPSLTLSASGGQPTTVGTANVALPSLTASSAGTVAIQGAGSATLPLLTTTAAGTVPRTGTGAVTLPALTLTGAGSVPRTGAGAVSLPMLLLVATGVDSNNLLEPAKITLSGAVGSTHSLTAEVPGDSPLAGSTSARTSLTGTHDA